MFEVWLHKIRAVDPLRIWLPFRSQDLSLQKPQHWSLQEGSGFESLNISGLESQVSGLEYPNFSGLEPPKCFPRSQDLSLQRLLWWSRSFSSGQFMSMRGPRIIRPCEIILRSEPSRSVICKPNLSKLLKTILTDPVKNSKIRAI